jgi:hypothetical protein
MFGEKKASLGIRARRIYGASILLVLQEYRKGISAEDCAVRITAVWTLQTRFLTPTTSENLVDSLEGTHARKERGRHVH